MNCENSSGPYRSDWFDANVIEILEEIGHFVMWFPKWFSKSDEKPHSLPKHWPKSTVEDLLERPKRLISVGNDQAFTFCSNFVKTSKYEVYNFIPKFLLEVRKCPGN
jgi:Phospholipid-translocating ATPase N-terminal